MRILYHPDFPKDIRKFAAGYKAISDGLAERFRKEITDALEAIKARPRAPATFCKRGQCRSRSFDGGICAPFPFSSFTV